MRTSRIFLILIFAFTISANVFSQDAESIINSYVKAVGGFENIQAIKTLRFTGKVASGGMDINFVQTFKRPMMFIAEITMQGLTMKQAYDGTKGWTLNPFTGKKEADLLPKDQEKFFRRQADFEGQLINYKDKGTKVELIGTEDYEGSQVYNIKATDKEGDVSNFFIDTESFLLLKAKDKLKIDTKEIETETILSNYKPVEGFLIPYSVEVKMPDNPMGTQKVVIDTIEANIPIEDSYFQMPETK